MSQKAVVPDAWDDDWESQADKPELPSPIDQGIVKVSKKERLAKHAALNKKLWETAESTDTFHFLQTKGEVPLKTEFKPAVQVLSRKPAPKLISRQDPTTGMSQLTVEDDDLDDEDATTKKQTLSPEEQKAQAQRAREEKQRRYEEARDRLFGGSHAASHSGGTSPGDVTPPTSSSAGGSIPRGSTGGSGTRGKGARLGPNTRPSSSSSLPADGTSRRPKQGTSRTTGEIRQLYDPNDTPRQEYVRNPETSRTPTPKEGVQPVRTPRGPDGSGRGGFGFSSRGGREVS